MRKWSNFRIKDQFSLGKKMKPSLKGVKIRFLKGKIFFKSTKNFPGPSTIVQRPNARTQCPPLQEGRRGQGQEAEEVRKI